jgi:ferrous iron transport protein B
MGHALEPVIAPLGYDWKIGIGLIGSFAAREVFVGTMAIVYNVEDDSEEDITPLRDTMRSERRNDDRPVFTPLVCVGLMVFYVLAMQCISTIVIVRRETNSWRWPLFQLGYMTLLAYLGALVVYQGGRLLGFE